MRASEEACKLAYSCSLEYVRHFGVQGWRLVKPPSALSRPFYARRLQNGCRKEQATFQGKEGWQEEVPG